MLRTLRIENFALIREVDLGFSAGLNAVTGETGAGKTILAQAIGLLLGARGDAGYVGPASGEAYVEAELDLPPGLLDDPGLEAVRELRPEGEEGLLAARRVFADGRTRAYAWGRAVAREDLARVVERLVAMSGQFEQRRLARPSFQLETLDGYIGEEQLQRRAEAARAWRELGAARRRLEEARRTASGEAERADELRILVERTEGLEEGGEDRLLAERDRLRHTTDLAEAAASAAEALVPDGDTQGASALVAGAERALGPVSHLAPELVAAGEELREADIRLRDTASSLRAFLATLEADPVRLEHVESELERIADAKRRFQAASYEHLLALAASARADLEAIDSGVDPVSAAEAELAEAEQRFDLLASELSQARAGSAARFAADVSQELDGLGMGDGEFRVELAPRESGSTGRDDVAFLIRPNAGLPFAPLADTASGGELSRVALALRSVAHAAGGEPTIVFDEIDAGIGGRTAHAVADALRRLADRAQILTITHLPQIASAAEAHFRVEKVAGDPTHTRIERLAEEDRREELERMLGGAEFLSTLR